VTVQTLDEIVLIFRRDSGLSFDETLPHFHFYGTDICMRAAEQGRQCYAISAFCVHNTPATVNASGRVLCVLLAHKAIMEEAIADSD